MQRRVVFACSAGAFVGFGLWLFFEPSFEPALGVIASIGGLASIFWPSLRARYVRKRLDGRVTFDYSNNNGCFSIGSDALFFETKWSKSSDDSIHIYNDPPSVDSVAIALGAASIESISDASRYDTTSRTRTLHEGEIAILRNKQGNYAAVHVLDVKDRSRADDRDELTFRYVINAEGNADFSR